MSLKRATLVLLPLLLVSPIAAGPEETAIKAYKKELSRVTARQRQYEAKLLDQHLRDAYETYRAPWSQRGGPEAPKVIDYDFSGYDAVYERWAAFDEEKGELALGLAKADGRKVAERLLDTLIDVLNGIARLEQVLLDSKPKTRSIHDQTPGIQRNGAWIHRDMVVAALARLSDPEAVKYLVGKGWQKADRQDRKKKSVRCRVALVDALAGTGTEVTRAFLGMTASAEEPAIRIAALQALAGPEPSKETKVRLETAAKNDSCRAVRVAARFLLGEKDEPAEGAPTFCGVPVASQRVILVLDASYMAIKPVDVELLKMKTWREWRAVADKDRNWVSQVDLLVEEAKGLVNDLPASARFNLILINEGNRVLPLDSRSMVRADPKGKHRAFGFLGEILAGGWAPQLAGLREAYRLAGADPARDEPIDDPEADTILLYSNGVPRGGRLLGEATWENLFLFYSDDLFTDKWTPHPENPIVSGVNNSRPAGRIFEHKGKLYRPAQNSIVRYGHGFNINEILVMNKSSYEEKTIKSIKPDWASNIVATHTFSQANNLSVIDVQIVRKKWL